MTERTPKFCPDCGAALTGETAVVGIIEDRSRDGGYDCYCASCEWSGDIWPDNEQGLHADEEAAQTSPSSPFSEPRTRRR